MIGKSPNFPMGFPPPESTLIDDEAGKILMREALQQWGHLLPPQEKAALK